MQFEQTKPPRGIVYDSNFGETIDTVLALALLHGFDGKMQARVAALCSSRSNLKSAQFCDVIEKFYASATTGIAAQFFQGLPIGLATGNKLNDDTPILASTLARKDSDGKLVYSPRIHELKDTAPPEVLIRNALLAQYDGNAAIVMAGPASNLARLLALKGAKEIVASKVRVLAMVDVDFTSDVAAAKCVAAEWPTPIVLCGRDLGSQFLFPGESIEKDFAYTPAHPVADAYRACHAMPYDAPSWAMTAMLYAIKPDDRYFKVSEPGGISIGDDGQAVFRHSLEGKHRRLLAAPGQKERILKSYTELASAKPVPRSFRRLQQQQNVDVKDEQKIQ